MTITGIIQPILSTAFIRGAIPTAPAGIRIIIHIRAYSTTTGVICAGIIIITRYLTATAAITVHCFAAGCGRAVIVNVQHPIIVIVRVAACAVTAYGVALVGAARAVVSG